jgi:L-lactate utilization protein LutC
LYNWINGKNVRKNNYDKLIKIFKNEIKITNNELKMTGKTQMEIDARYIIELQKDKIIILEKEIKTLKIKIKALIKTVGAENINRPN